MKFEVIRENPPTPPVTEIVITLTREEALVALGNDTTRHPGPWLYIPGAWQKIERALL